MSFGLRDLTVVIPTRDRWEILRRTLFALREQGGDELDVVVVVDGVDQKPPDLGSVQLLQVPQGGPGKARNSGVELTGRRLLLFLGDDIIPAPGMLNAHLARHSSDPDPSVAVMGKVDWHPDVAASGLHRWMDRTSLQFDFASIGPDRVAGWTRFYSCNVSMKRSLFESVAGFDPDFVYYYEDLDVGWRLHGAGMKLVYEPAAAGQHLHAYDVDRLRRRFAGVARGERMMAEKHDWFEPWFEPRFRAAAAEPAVSRIWENPVLVNIAARAPYRVKRAVERKAELRYMQEAARAFLEVWDAPRSPKDDPDAVEGLLNTNHAFPHRDARGVPSRRCD